MIKNPLVVEVQSLRTISVVCVLIHLLQRNYFQLALFVLIFIKHLFFFCHALQHYIHLDLIKSICFTCANWFSFKVSRRNLILFSWNSFELFTIRDYTFIASNKLSELRLNRRNAFRYCVEKLLPDMNNNKTLVISHSW